MCTVLLLRYACLHVPAVTQLSMLYEHELSEEDPALQYIASIIIIVAVTLLLYLCNFAGP